MAGYFIFIGRNCRYFAENTILKVQKGSEHSVDRMYQYIVFTLDEKSYALRLSAVEKVFRVVEVTPLPEAPEIVHGVVNIQGRIIPVVNIRKRFNLPEREMDLRDQFIIARTSRRAVALVVDAVSGAVELPEEKVNKAEEILPRLQYVEGVVKLDGDMVLILNLDQLLSLEEEKMLDDEVTKK